MEMTENKVCQITILKAESIRKKNLKLLEEKQNKTGHIQRTRNQNGIRLEDNGAMPSKC